MDYYRKKIYIPQVDRHDQILGGVERWQAHRKGILHRGFTVVLMVGNEIVLQHRKHPVFDGYFDISFSSHQMYLDDTTIQSPAQAINNTFRREWHYNKKHVLAPQKIGSFYYKKKDPQSKFYEHEINHIYKITLNETPLFNPLYAYGASLISKDRLVNRRFPLFKAYAPWVFDILSLL